MSITPEIELDDDNFPECPSCYAEIDTWPVEKRAIERERERIIKLLEAKLTTTRELFDDSDGFESHVGNRYSGMIMAYETAISLIKGETE